MLFFTDPFPEEWIAVTALISALIALFYERGLDALVAVVN